MRLLGIDYGTKRVGLALSDNLGLMAHPYMTLVKTTRERLFSDLLAIIAREKVQAVVLGLPQSPDGGEAEITKQVRNFAQSLLRRIDIPVYFQNEAFTSCLAENHLHHSGRRGRKAQSVLDQQAAVIILNDYLEQNRTINV
jgi:putative holliday junction resolvase